MLERFNEEQRKVRAAVKERLVGYVLGALGLVAGLAWNDAIKAAIESVFPVDGTGTGIAAKFLYAIILTVLIAVAAYYISKFFAGESGGDKK